MSGSATGKLMAVFGVAAAFLMLTAGLAASFPEPNGTIFGDPGCHPENDDTFTWRFVGSNWDTVSTWKSDTRTALEQWEEWDNPDGSGVIDLQEQSSGEWQLILSTNDSIGATDCTSKMIFADFDAYVNEPEFGTKIFIHEMGHALGLLHTGIRHSDSRHVANGQQKVDVPILSTCLSTEDQLNRFQMSLDDNASLLSYRSSFEIGSWETASGNVGFENSKRWWRKNSGQTAIRGSNPNPQNGDNYLRFTKKAGTASSRIFQKINLIPTGSMRLGAYFAVRTNTGNTAPSGDTSYVFKVTVKRLDFEPDAAIAAACQYVIDHDINDNDPANYPWQTKLEFGAAAGSAWLEVGEGTSLDIGEYSVPQAWESAWTQLSFTTNAELNNGNPHFHDVDDLTLLIKD